MQCAAGECIPIDDPVAFGEPVNDLPQPPVRCAVCGTRAEWVSPAELAEAWGDMLASAPVEGQTTWLP